MPKSKNYRTYPEAFSDLLREAVTRPVRIACPTIKDARKLQGHIFGFKGSLKIAADQKDCDPDVRELYHIGEKVKLSLDETPGEYAVVAMPRDQDPLAKMVESALKAQGAATPAADSIQPSSGLIDFIEKGDNS